MMGRSPRFNIPSFVEIGLLVPEKKILKGFYHISAWRSSWSCDPDAVNKVSFPYPWRIHIKFAIIGQVVSEEKIFEKCVRTDVRRTPDHGYTTSSTGGPAS